MADRHYDEIVIGGGLLGSAVAYALSRNRKNSALLIDAREKGHAQGSSHGHSRIVRTVASESPHFGTMARESFRRMQEMNRSGRFVAGPVDALFMSFAASDDFKEMARKNDKPILNAADIFDRWGIQLPDAGVGIVDGFSGILDPSALLDIFYEEIGEENILWQTAVASWTANATGVSVTTAKGDTYSAGKLVLAAGAWLPALLGCGPVDTEVFDRLSRMTVERIPLYYFDYPDKMPAVIPVTLSASGHPDMYAMPEFDHPVAAPAQERPRYLKVGFHEGAVTATPGEVDRTVRTDEQDYAIAYMRERLGLNLTLDHTGLCLYAMPPDLRKPGEKGPYNELPWIGELPGTKSVFLAAYGAGICAKHALAIGDQVCAMLVQGTKPDYNDFDPLHRLHL